MSYPYYGTANITIKPENQQPALEAISNMDSLRGEYARGVSNLVHFLGHWYGKVYFVASTPPSSVHSPGTIYGVEIEGRNWNDCDIALFVTLSKFAEPGATIHLKDEFGNCTLYRLDPAYENGYREEIGCVVFASDGIGHVDENGNWIKEEN